MSILNKLTDLYWNAVVLAWDNSLFALNLVTPKLQPGHVVPVGGAGAGQKWPEYVPPKEGEELRKL